jgi:hypothetical protein
MCGYPDGRGGGADVEDTSNSGLSRAPGPTRKNDRIEGDNYRRCGRSEQKDRRKKKASETEILALTDGSLMLKDPVRNVRPARTSH